MTNSEIVPTVDHIGSSPDSVAACSENSYTVVGGKADAGIIILCDHAANGFPAGYGTLGLPQSELKRHIAYDIGAAAVTRSLAHALEAPALLTHYSRLLIDPNRGEDDPTMIMRLSDGAIVPGNRHIDHEERSYRVDHFYRPYHDAIDSVIDQCIGAGRPPAILSIHSFTESWKGMPRPWHAGVLWDRDSRLAQPLLEHLYAQNDLIVGDNEPYRGDLKGDTMWQHGTMRGLAHAIVEIRQDLIRDEAGQAAWADRMRTIVSAILSEADNAAAFRDVRSPPND